MARCACEHETAAHAVEAVAQQRANTAARAQKQLAVREQESDSRRSAVVQRPARVVRAASANREGNRQHVMRWRRGPPLAAGTQSTLARGLCSARLSLSLHLRSEKRAT